MNLETLPRVGFIGVTGKIRRCNTDRIIVTEICVMLGVAHFINVLKPTSKFQAPDFCFLSYDCHRQTDRQTDRQTSSFIL